jgi:hypothetical protein
MSFKKILPWLIGVIVLVLVAVGAFFSRFWLFGGRIAGGQMMRGFQQGGGFQRGGPNFGGNPMMGGGFGGHMGGFGGFGLFGMILGPLFFVALFLFTVWALLKIIRASTHSGANYAAPFRNCPNCGKPVSADWRHCPNCGTDLNPPATPPADPTA